MIFLPKKYPKLGAEKLARDVRFLPLTDDRSCWIPSRKGATPAVNILRVTGVQRHGEPHVDTHKTQRQNKCLRTSGMYPRSVAELGLLAQANQRRKVYSAGGPETIDLPFR